MQSLDPPSLPSAAQFTPPVLNYATADELTPSRRTVIATRAFAVVHLLLGLGGILWGNMIIFSFDDGPWFIGGAMIGCSTIHCAVAWFLFRPRVSSWKAARLMLALLLLPALGFIAFGVALFVLYHNKSGWDQLGAVIGVMMALVATAPYVLNLLTLRYLMRPYPRALFRVSVTDSFIGRKTFMRIMAALWVIAAVVAAAAWLV